MRVKYTYKAVGESCEYESIKSFAETKLDGEDYETGAVEAARDTARNNSQAIGRLLDILAERGMLGGEDVLSIVGCRGEIKLEDL